jgi:hypothetical protein
MKRLLIVPVLLLAACGGEPTAEELGEASSELQISDWSRLPSPTVDSAYDPQDPAVVTFNGTQYIVFRVDEDLYWKKRTATGWTGKQRIFYGQYTSQCLTCLYTVDRPSLAVFNGFLYMLFANRDDRSEIFMTRMEAATETWSEPVLISYEGMYGPPAIAVFDGKLMFVGAVESAATHEYPMWVGAMNAAEEFSVSKKIGAAHAAATQPSLAVHGDKLYVAHRNGQSGDIVYSTLTQGQAATDWSTPLPVTSGNFGTAAFGRNPSIASVGGYLHLVHTRGSNNGEESMEVWWTYFNGCTWAPELAIPRLTAMEKDYPSLTRGGEGLVAVTADYSVYDEMLAYEYDAPPAPVTPPRCGVVGP